jgi:glycosyltransferase involved in cell wall biosynthesis
MGVFRQISRIFPGSFHVVFCAAAEPGRVFDMDFSGVSYEILDGVQWRPLRQINPYSYKWNPGVVTLLRQMRPDFMVLSGYAHPTMIVAARWASANSVPYSIACETSAHSTSISGLRWRLRRLVAGPLVRRMKFGLPVGRNAAQYLRSLSDDNIPMHYFPNTPETSRFQAIKNDVERSGVGDSIRTKYGLSRTGAVFTFAGRMIDAKRPLDVITAFRRLPRGLECSLLIVGDGPLKERAISVAGSDSRIAFGGWVSDADEIARIFSISTALVLPSEHEPWGAVVNEAMASGACVIATDRVGAASELLEHGIDGFLVRVGDVDAIRAAMLALILDSQRAQQMGLAARDKAVRFGEEFAAGNLVGAVIGALAV